MITLFDLDGLKVANETLNTVWNYIHLFSAAPYKLGSMCGKSTSTGCMGNDMDLNPHPYGCNAWIVSTTST